MQNPLLQRIHIAALVTAAGAVPAGALAADSPVTTLVADPGQLRHHGVRLCGGLLLRLLGL